MNYPESFKEKMIEDEQSGADHGVRVRLLPQCSQKMPVLKKR